MEGGARRRRRGSCAAARPAACPGWISPSRHGRPPGRREGEGTQGGGAVPASAKRAASVGRPPRAGPPQLCSTTARRARARANPPSAPSGHLAGAPGRKVGSRERGRRRWRVPSHGPVASPRARRPASVVPRPPWPPPRLQGPPGRRAAGGAAAASSGLGCLPPAGSPQWPRRRSAGGGAALARRPPAEIERKEREMRGGRRRSGVFLSIKFKKHSKRVCSGMVRRFVKL